MKIFFFEVFVFVTTILAESQKLVVGVLDSFKYILIRVIAELRQNVHKLEREVLVSVEVGLDIQHSFSKSPTHVWDLVLASLHEELDVVLLKEV